MIAKHLPPFSVWKFLLEELFVGYQVLLFWNSRGNLRRSYWPCPSWQNSVHSSSPQQKWGSKATLATLPFNDRNDLHQDSSMQHKGSSTHSNQISMICCSLGAKLQNSEIDHRYVICADCFLSHAWWRLTHTNLTSILHSIVQVRSEMHLQSILCVLHLDCGDAKNCADVILSCNISTHKRFLPRGATFAQFLLVRAYLRIPDGPEYLVQYRNGWKGCRHPSQVGLHIHTHRHSA